MPISVIISNLNGARFLPKLLGSLKEQLGVTLQVIVVDRQSKDESSQILAQHPDIEVVSEPPESGLVAGYAVGARHARHEYLFFSNEDMYYSRDCLRLVQEQFHAPGVDRVGAVMPFQVGYDGEWMVNGGTWFTKSTWASGTPYPFRVALSRHAFGPETVAGINAGACMISRAAYDDVGGWDPTFFLDYEDLDLNIRLWQRGWTSRLEPRALVYHAVGASNLQTIHRGRSTVARKRYVAALSNQLVVALKYFNGWSTMLAPAVLGHRIARSVVRGNLENLRLDLKAVWLTAQRLPAVLRYRKQHRSWNRERPGQLYFHDERFDVSTPFAEPLKEAGPPARGASR
jgi:GT2 family glycosyltransferase